MAAARSPAKASRPPCRLATRDALVCLAPGEPPRRADAAPCWRDGVRPRSLSAANELRSEPRPCQLAPVDFDPPRHWAWASKHHGLSPYSAPGRRVCNPDPKAHPNERAFLRAKLPLWTMTQAVQGTVSAHPRGTKAVELASRARLLRGAVPATVSLGGFVRRPDELVEFWVWSPELTFRASSALRLRCWCRFCRRSTDHGSPRSWRRSTGSPLHSARQRCPGAVGHATHTIPP